MEAMDSIFKAILGLGATAVTASTGLLINLAIRMGKVETELTHIKKKLPNGEVEEIYKMVKDLHKRGKVEEES